MRKARCDQLKENASTESAVNSTEIKKSENREISKSQTDSNNDEPKPKSAVHKAQTDESACHSILSTPETEVDSNTEGTGDISFDITVQHKNGPSHLFIDEQFQNESKESNRENMIEDDSDPMVTTSEKLSSKVLVKKFDDIPQIGDERDKSTEKTEQKITDDQSLHAFSKKESSYGETDHMKDVDVNCGSSQTPLVTSKIGNDSVDKSLLTFEDETCGCVNEKHLTENLTIPGNQNQAMVKSETNCENASIVVARTEESNSLTTEFNQSFQDDSVIKTIFNDSEAVAADCTTVGFDSEDNGKWDESQNGNEETFESGCVNKESSGALTLPGSGVFNHEEGLKHAVKHDEDDVTTCELIGSQSKLFNDEIIEEAELRTSKEASMAGCKNAANSMNSTVATIDVVNPTSSIDTENLESENSKAGSVNTKDEKIQTMDASGSVRTELNENVGKVETAKQQKTSKTKKGKKTKSKEQTEDKVKSKEKGEKKRKKEKKSVKDKIDKEVNLDSEEKKKSTPAAKEQDKKVLSTCHIDTGKELMTDTSCAGESCSAKNDDGDDDDDDDDNWESNFDESGDCLNPDYLEEV